MMHYEAIEMHTCRLSMFLEKVKLDKVMSVLGKKLIIIGNWLMVRISPSSYGCTWEVAKHSRN